MGAQQPDGLGGTIHSLEPTPRRSSGLLWAAVTSTRAWIRYPYIRARGGLVCSRLLTEKTNAKISLRRTNAAPASPFGRAHVTAHYRKHTAEYVKTRPHRLCVRPGVRP